jgi:DNA-binding Lrp family transcriptional regulator
MEELDAIDMALLDQLQVDAGLTNQDLARKVHVSAPTCLRRVARLQAAGLVERRVAILARDKLVAVVGHGIDAVVEVTLDRQDAEAMDAFEARAVTDEAVQQVYRVSPGPDFMLVLHTDDMPGYLAVAQRLFTADANVRNVKAFFATKRAKFDPRIPLRPRRGLA